VTGAKRKTRIFAKAALKPGMRVLDMGCGKALTSILSQPMI
jgi:cyclopropane fatty-acyl-phospholipid synthase-like methyltransferase